MMTGSQAIFGGLAAYGFLHIPATSPIKSWQALFLTYGLLTFIWGWVVMLRMPDSPMKAKCFTERDKKLMMERVRENKTGIQNRVFRKDQVKEAFTDPQSKITTSTGKYSIFDLIRIAYAFAMIQLCTTIPSGGIGTFSNILVKSFGFDVIQTILLTMVNGILMVIIMLSAAYIDRRYQRPTMAMLASTIPSIAATVVFLTVRIGDQSGRIGLLLSFYLIFSFWAASSLALSLLSRNVAGQTKKSTVLATNFVFWAVGNAIGPQIFISTDAPRYTIAFSITMACWVLLAITILLLRLYYKFQNQRKDRLIASDPSNNQGTTILGFEDITDGVRIIFEYLASCIWAN
jgi:hypothetical protein